jgi:hypothetical protein
MVISKRLLLSLVALAMAGTGLAMYLGMQLGMDVASAPQPVPTVPVAATSEPVCEDPQAMTVVVEHTHPEREHPHGNEGGSGGDGYTEIGDFATNSGTIEGSQFTDGGFGDLGQQWWNVVVNGHVTSVVVTENGTADVSVGDEAIVVVEEPPASPVAAPPAAEPADEEEPVATTTTTTPSTTSTTVATAGPEVLQGATVGATTTVSDGDDEG